MAIMREPEGFVKLVKGNPLGANTRILTKKSSNPLRKSRDGKSTLSETKYVLIEQDDKLQPQRVFIVNETVTVTVYPSASKEAAAALSKASPAQVMNKDGSTTITTYSYKGADVEEANLNSAPNQEYIKAMDSFEKGADCIQGAGQSTLCKVSDATVQLIRAASRHASDLAAKIKGIRTKGVWHIDTAAPKYLSFEINKARDQVRNVVLAGFIRAQDENFSEVAPDGTSAWVIKFGTNTSFKIVERVQDYKANNSDFEFLK